MSLRIAILMDPPRVREEKSAMLRLAVALAAEGVNTIIGHAQNGDDPTSITQGPIPQITLPGKIPFWLREGAARLTAEQLEHAGGHGPIDALVVSGNESFDLALRTSRILDCPMIADVRSREEADFIARRPEHVSLAVAATEPIQRRMSARLGEDHVECIRPCLPAVSSHEPSDGRFMVMLGPPRDSSIWNAALDGVSDATDQLPEENRPMLAIELLENRADQQVWAHARERGLLDRVVSIDQIDHLRPLLSSAASIIIPEPRQMVRSVFAQAMQRGVVPIAAEDSDMDFIEDGVTAMTLRTSELRKPSAWAERIHAVCSDCADLPLSDNARERASEFLASRVAPRWATLLHSMVHGDSIPLSQT